MTKIKEFLHPLYELIKEFILVALFSIACISLPDAKADGGTGGGIVVGRYVPQRSAVSPSVVPGRAIFVDTSPDDILVSALSHNALSNNGLSSLTELNEKDFAAITTDNPAVHLNSQINAEGLGNISQRAAGTGLAANVMLPTSGLGGVLKGTGATISGSITRSTSSIGQSIAGATGFLK